MKNLYLLPVLLFVSYSSFSLQTPETSHISKPLNNAVGVSAPTLKVTASPVTGARRFTIELNTASDFTGTSIIRVSEKDDQRTLIFTGLKYLKTYYARAKTEISGYGRVSKFTTQAEIFPTVLEQSEADAANPVVFRVTLNPVPNATSYMVELNQKSDFSGSSLVMTSTLPGQSSFIFKGLQYGTDYYVRSKSNINTRFGPAAKVRTRDKISAQRLWGLTTAGGEHAAGTVFSLSVDSGTFTKHHDYIEQSDYPNAYPTGTLTHAPDGGFFGNSECERNGTCGNGEIFHISKDGAYSLVSQPFLHAGSVMLASNDQLYILHDWINMFQGGIIRMPAGNSEFELSQIIFSVKNKLQGQNPRTALVELPDGFLYGVAPYGGISDHGVVYKIRLDGSGFKVIHNFSAQTGSYPQGNLLAGTDGYLYGTTFSGGGSGKGTVFKISPDGTSFTTLVTFTGPNGANAHGSLVENQGRIFGMTPSGGDYNRGVLFSVNLDGSGFKKMFNFNGINGAAPLNTPTIVGDYVYGITTGGGVNGNGVIFKMRKAGGGFQKIHDFTLEDGSSPNGGLLLSEDFFAPAASSESLAGTEAGSTLSYEVGVFPNPFVSSFTAEINGKQTGNVRLVVTNMYGEVVEEAVSSINGAAELGDRLTKGIYILKVIHGEEVSSHRIVKK